VFSAKLVANLLCFSQDCIPTLQAPEKCFIDAVAKRAKQILLAVTDPAKSCTARHQAMRRAKQQEWAQR
jgi:hypothetical protein